MKSIKSDLPDPIDASDPEQWKQDVPFIVKGGVGSLFAITKFTEEADLYKLMHDIVKRTDTGLTLPPGIYHMVLEKVK